MVYFSKLSEVIFEFYLFFSVFLPNILITQTGGEIVIERALFFIP